MKKLIGWLGLLTSLVALATEATEPSLMREITENIRAVCEKPSNKGEYWKIQGKAEGNAKVRLMKLGGTKLLGEVDFTKEEWEGVRHVLEERKDYRACARDLTPLFLEKFVPTPNSKGIHQETHGSGSPAVANTQGNVTITITPQAEERKAP